MIEAPNDEELVAMLQMTDKERKEWIDKQLATITKPEPKK